MRRDQPIMVCDLTKAFDVNQGNKWLWEHEEDLKVVKIWRKASDLGIRGNDDACSYIKEIKRLEKQDYLIFK